MLNGLMDALQQFGGYAVIVGITLYMYQRLVSQMIQVVQNNTEALTKVTERLTGVEDRVERVEDRLETAVKSGIMSTGNKAAVPQKEGWDG